MLGMQGSMPAWLILTAAFLLLVLVRYVSVALLRSVNAKEVRMENCCRSFREFGSVLLETVWAAGVSQYVNLVNSQLV